MKESVRKETEELLKPPHNNFLHKEKGSCSVEEFRGKVDWLYITHHVSLSEDFIREYDDQVHWPNVSAFQKLSFEFILDFKNKIDFSILEENIHFSMEEYDNYREKRKINNRFEILDLRGHS